MLRRLDKELGHETVGSLTRERLIRYGQERARSGAGPATLAIDLSFIGTVLSHAAEVHELQTNLDAVKLARVALAWMGAIATAMRLDEIVRVEWKDLDLRTKTILVRTRWRD